MNSYSPIIFKASFTKKIDELEKNHPGLIIVDEYEDQVNELYKIRYPKQANNTTNKTQFFLKLFGKNFQQSGNWVFYPWRNTAVHLLEEDLFHEVRTARNFPLISTSDQQKFHQSCVAIVGLSVGSSIAQTIAQSGGCNTMKLADFDVLSLSNLNRIRASVMHLGQNKTIIVAQQIYELNPYAKLILYPDGLNPNNIEDFLIHDPKPQLVIDEADDLATKQYLRLATRSLQLPLMMTTDNGYESNTRVIRFDQSQSAGGMKDVPSLTFNQVVSAFKKHEPAHLSKHQKLRLIAKLVGINQVSYEMQKGSILTARGKTAGWPQIAMTVFLGGSLATYTAKQIITGKKTPHKQTSFSLTTHLNPNHHSQKSKTKRKKHTQLFKKFLKNAH